MSDLFDKLEAIYAYDVGCVDSGIRDESLRAELVEKLDSIDSAELRVALSHWVRKAYLSDEALDQGYGWEDALSFLRWIDDGDYRR